MKFNSEFRKFFVYLVKIMYQDFDSIHKIRSTFNFIRSNDYIKEFQNLKIMIEQRICV